MLAWYLAAASGGIALGALGALVFAYLLAETLLKIYDKLENPNTAAGADSEFDPDEERLDLIAIRDLLTAATIVGAFNGGEDSNLRHAIWELRAATDRGRDRFNDLLDDLDGQAEADDAEPAKAAVDA